MSSARPHSLTCPIERTPVRAAPRPISVHVVAEQSLLATGCFTGADDPGHAFVGLAVDDDDESTGEAIGLPIPHCGRRGWRCIRRTRLLHSDPPHRPRDGSPGDRFARSVLSRHRNRPRSRSRGKIKPGSDPSPINLLSRGVTPVAILGSDTFDAAAIDAATLGFGPGDAPPAHKKGGHLEDISDDGQPDLVSHDRTEETDIAPGDGEACVTGETLDGIPFEGCDDITTVPACGIGFELALLLPPLMWAFERRRGRATRSRQIR